jgi:hypothetical protein
MDAEMSGSAVGSGGGGGSCGEGRTRAEAVVGALEGPFEVTWRCWVRLCDDNEVTSAENAFHS